MKAHRVEQNRKNAVAALAMTSPEFGQLNSDDDPHGDIDCVRSRAMSDWAVKERRSGFLEEVVNDAFKIDTNRGIAKKMMVDIIETMKTMVDQIESDHKATQRVTNVMQTQTLISLLLAAVIIYMHSTRTNLVVVNQSFLSTFIVVIAGFAIITAIFGFRVKKTKSHPSDEMVGQKLQDLLDKARAANNLLRETGNADEVESKSGDSRASDDLHRLPLDQFQEPAAEDFMIRSTTYMVDHKKVKSQSALFKLIAVDLVETSHNMQNLASHPENRVALAYARGGEKTFTLIYNFMIPGPPFLSFSAYWKVDLDLVNADTPFGRIAKPFFFGDSDEFRDNRFKFIPKVVEGNFAIKMAIKDTPTLMGHKLKQYYHRTDHYLEIDVDISSSAVARNVTGLVLGYAKTLEIHMALVLQGETEDELPEVVMGTCSARHVDLFSATELESHKEHGYID
jgi:hypothetical protein